MRKSRVLTAAVVICVLMAAASPGAQEKKSPASKEQTIEELFLQNIEFQILREKALRSSLYFYNESSL